MARCYSAIVGHIQTLPKLWLLSDIRNDARLEATVRRMPRGSGLVFRHYHLNEPERRARFNTLARIARSRGHVVVLAGSAQEARRWGAQGAYGGSSRLAPGPALLRLVSAHNFREIGKARRMRADTVLLSPVFPTRSHPGAKWLGPVRFRLLAQASPVPVIALGGMNRHRAHSLEWKNWAAVEGI